MAITEYEDQIQEIVSKPDHSEFIYDFLSVYDIPRATVTKLRKGMNNLAKEAGAVYLKNKLYFREGTGDLMQDYADLQERVDELGSKPRYLLVTDYQHLLAKDTKTNETFDIEFAKLPQYFDFFLAWNGIEKADFDKENPADVRAAERFAKLYDVVVKDNPDATRKGLNLFLIRILFCLFAEDTNIFEHDLFTNRVKQMTTDDGSNFDQFIGSLFGVLDFEKAQRPVDTPSWLNDFPYVDGDLFKDQHESLHFSAKSRKLIIEAGELLKWDQINPDILGSMIQAVASEDSRSHLGMHYTSVPNIMKVIKPLFLDGLREDFEAAKGNEDKLQQLYDRIGRIKFMDPACGSGNFLIITYKELRQLEIDILIELNNIGVSTMYVPSVTLDQFYGIEIDDFACDVTRLSLWIAEHQMNVKLHKQISDAVRPTLPLQHAGAILQADSLSVDWNSIMQVDLNTEAYVFGNPPYVGHSKQTTNQKKMIRKIFTGISGSGYLDYIAGWLELGFRYILGKRAKIAFVTTNSIFEGEQVAILWPHILEKLQIHFAYQSFKWKNNAKGNAGVTVAIVGLQNKNDKIQCRLYGDQGFKCVNHISPYLIEGSDDVVEDLSLPLSPRPEMQFGNKPTDGGGLIFNDEEYNEAKSKYPELKRYLRRYVGSDELVKGKRRYVLWLSEHDVKALSNNPLVQSRLDIVRSARLKSGTPSTKQWASKPYMFKQIAPYYKKQSLHGYVVVVPAVSSENREYIPMGYLSNEDTILNNRVYGVFDASLWLFAILQSRMHLVWVDRVGGKLETRYSYSSGICYNAFPFPVLTERKKVELEEYALRILDIREELGGSLADMYGTPCAKTNAKPMNLRLRDAHQALDKAVDRAYRSNNFPDNNSRFELLMSLYKEEQGDISNE
ncbi:DNA methyltransferase [Liquorilactobacillus satsumensis]|uniref:DNA methyltransferase n=1 Tax=Liquorilactobacillus TaxID=2767888 RepID=UPI0021C3A4B8|nr:DNA methyltransferase [Liquorilactobacillus satsumensis]MCP9329106.1 class I SAM-dependent DNA methyltransferase [Liquorilactobacillus satsumensis]